MLSKALLYLTNSFPSLRRRVFHWLFQALARRYGQAQWWTFMNYGYAADDATPGPALEPADEAERYPIQLYHEVAAGGPFPLAGREVLEIGCGRGGGASYVARYLSPARMTAIDFSEEAIGFCRRTHSAPNLEYRHGDAEALPFADDSFDAVINVESSFCYADMNRFLGEVRRVLRPGGVFLFADLRLAHEVEALEAALAGSGLNGLALVDITDEVVRALELDDRRRSGTVEREVGWLLRGPMRTFTGVRGSRIHRGLKNREMVYLRAVLAKQAEVPARALAAG
jgi:SAM-dependent methyltransferase